MLIHHSAYRPGSIMMPETPSINMTCRMRLNTLEIHCTNRWRTQTSKFSLQDCPPNYPELQPSQYQIVSYLEDVVRNGHQLLQQLWSLYDGRTVVQPDTDLLHCRLLTLWRLYGSLSARLCEAEALPGENVMDILARTAAAGSELLKHVTRQVVQLGLWNDELMESEGPISLPGGIRASFDGLLAASVNKEQGENIDILTRHLVDLNFALQMESLDT